MSFENLSRGGLDYNQCQYGQSKLVFRGPFRMPQAVDVAVLGGSEVYGKFVEKPFPVLLEQAIGRTVINLGCMNASIDAFLDDPIIPEVCARARVAVVQVMGAQSLSNRYYGVHPRRNDRFVAAYGTLRQLYPEMDFSQFNFTRHLLTSLKDVSPDRFSEVVADLRRSWMMRMYELVSALGMPTVLLWISDHPPGLADDSHPDESGSDPLFVTREMLDQMSRITEGLVEVVRPLGDPDHTVGMVFTQFQRSAAEAMPGLATHAEVAAALCDELPPLIEQA